MASKMAPGSAQEAPRGLQEAPKMPPRGPQEAPRVSPEAPKTLQEAPGTAKRPPRRPKRPQRGSQETSQETPRSIQEASGPSACPPLLLVRLLPPPSPSSPSPTSSSDSSSILPSWGMAASPVLCFSVCSHASLIKATPLGIVAGKLTDKSRQSVLFAKVAVLGWAAGDSRSVNNCRCVYDTGLGIIIRGGRKHQ